MVKKIKKRVPALNTDNVYLFKNKIVIPPLTMQDDTLGIGVGGYKSRKMNIFLTQELKSWDCNLVVKSVRSYILEKNT